VIRFTPWPLYSREKKKIRCNTQKRSLVRFQSRCGSFGEEKSDLLLIEIGDQGSDLVTITDY